MNETYIFGTTCFCHFLPCLFELTSILYVWIFLDIVSTALHEAPGQKGDSCMQVIKQVHLNRMNGLETFQTHH